MDWTTSFRDRRKAKQPVVTDEFRALFNVDIRENIANGMFDTTSGTKYRFIITKVTTGEPVKVGYGLTYKQTYRLSEEYISKLFRKQLNA